MQIQIDVKNLRNLFDQYDKDEDKLTHSLLHTIASDEKLFVDFISFALDKSPFKKDKIFVGSQGRYGDEISASISKKGKESSVPDAIMHDSSACVLIESKVTAAINKEQLENHLKQAQRRGFKNPILLLLTSDREKPDEVHFFEKSGHNIYWKSWWGIYQWMGNHNKPPMVGNLRKYMEVLELNIIKKREGGWDGMLTQFEGIPFGSEDYSYGKAKGCLNAFVGELKKHPELKRIYPNADITKGRGAITGEEQSEVWDCIPLENGEENFTKQPHLSFVIKPDWTQVQITLPNQAKGEYWRALTSRDKEKLSELLLTIHERFKKKQPKNSKLMVQVLHRHYKPGDRRIGVRDGEIYFDVDCLLGKEKKSDPKVKTFTAWLDALDGILKDRSKANRQIAIIARYDHVEGSIVGKPEFVGEAIRAVGALKPFYSSLIKE